MPSDHVADGRPDPAGARRVVLRAALRACLEDGATPYELGSTIREEFHRAGWVYVLSRGWHRDEEGWGPEMKAKGGDVT